MSARNAPSVRDVIADAITYHPGNRAGTPDARHPVSLVLADAALAALRAQGYELVHVPERARSDSWAYSDQDVCWLLAYTLVLPEVDAPEDEAEAREDWHLETMRILEGSGYSATLVAARPVEDLL